MGVHCVVPVDEVWLENIEDEVGAPLDDAEGVPLGSAEPEADEA